MKILGDVIKSKSDNRTFKAIQLANQIDCLIISDPEAEKSGAALSVGIGSLLDPIEAQGLAHYLEHMLFMGTNKYPNQNDYNQYLAKNSGSSNAYTSQSETNYYFQVASHAFFEALDRFAQFFINPLMAQSSSERQLNAVHSEHSKNLLNDLWRTYQLWKSSAKPGHPLTKFSTGDKTTLDHPNIRNQLLEFYNKYYSSNLMKLVIYSKQNVELLAQVINEKFGSVVNKNLEPYRMGTLPFDQNNLGNLYKVISIKNKQSLQYTWILENQETHYRNHPGKYMSHLIGHEGPGSLLSLLIKQGLALQLTAGSTDQHHAFCQLEVTISLTDKGLQNPNLITQYVCYYIEMLKQNGPQEWVYKQIQKINKLKFDNLDKQQGMSYCSRLAKKMQDTVIEQIFIKEYFMQQWKPQLISNFLNQITLKNLRITFTSNKFGNQCNLTEPIYGTKYSIQPIQNIVPRPGKVSLPPPNVFFPDNIDVLPLSTVEIPAKLYSSQYIDLFHKQDHRFALPKGQIKLRIYFQFQINPKLQVIKALYQQLLRNQLRQLKYMGQTAYINTTLTLSTFFIQIDIRGFNDSIKKILPAYLDQILAFTPNDLIQYEDLRSKKRREYQNFFKDNPYQQAYQYHLLSLRDGFEVDPSAKLIQIDNIKFNDLVQFSKSWKNQVFTELYTAGNITNDESIRIGKLIEENLSKISRPLPKHLISSIRSVMLKQNQIWAIEKQIRNPNQPNDSLIFHYQYEKYGITTKILQDLCINFINEPAFDYLRTKQQLGYIVMCLPDDHRGILGISILIQSNIKGSHQLKLYINNLIKLLKENLQKLTAQELQIYKKSLYSSKLQKDKSLDVQTTRFWGQIAKHIYNFTRREEQLQAILKITLEEFKEFFTRVFLTNPKCFETHLISSAHKQSNEVVRAERLKSENLKIASSIEWFKKRMPLYPDYYAHL